MRLAALALAMLGTACSPDYQEILIPVSSCQDGDFEKFRSETLSSGLDAQLCGQTLEEIVMSFSEE